MSEDAGIYARDSEYLGRYVQFGEAGRRVISVSFPESIDDDVSGEHDLLDRVERYLGGTREEFDDVIVALTVPTKHRRVLEAVREIGYGEEIDCDRLATMAAGIDPTSDDDLRTVRTALAENPAPLLVPDHRVRDGPSAAPPHVEGKLRSIEGL